MRSSSDLIIFTLATAVSPSWQAIGKLAAISGVRTFLNHFLQLELQELEKRNNEQ